MKEKELLKSLLSWLDKRHDEGTNYFSIQEKFSIPGVIELLVPAHEIKHDISYSIPERTCLIRFFQKEDYHEMEIHFDVPEHGPDLFLQVAKKNETQLKAIGAILLSRIFFEEEHVQFLVKLLFPVKTAKKEFLYMIKESKEEENDMLYEANDESFRALIKIEGKYVPFFNAIPENDRH